MVELVSAVQTSPAWFQSPVGVLASLVVLALAAVGLGRGLAKLLRSEAHATRLIVIFGVVFLAAYAVLIKWPPKFGVDLRGGITIIGQLRQDVERAEAIDIKTMLPQLIARVDPTGTQEILIRPLGTDKIEVVIPDVEMDEAMDIWEKLTQAGELKFRIVADRRHQVELIPRAIELINNGIGDSFVRTKTGEAAENSSGKIIGRWYELARLDPDALLDYSRRTRESLADGVIPFKFMPDLTHLVRNARTKQLISVEPFRGSSAQFARWADEQKIGRIEILCVEPEGPDDVTNVEGEHLARVFSGSDEYGRPAVHFNMGREGARRMGTLTSRNRSTEGDRKLLAIVSDGRLISAPSINDVISSSGIIFGDFTQREVKNLVDNLNAGKLEVALSPNPISQDFQQSAIGEELKRSGVIACIISLATVVFFMCLYYRFGGLVASFVLLLNVLLVLAIVMLIKQPITLTGLAGIVLTIGMSVDANVLIYERIREELKKGAALRMAIRNGYDRAMTTIIDANVTTILTAIVLYVIGTEQLKGFSLTLILGILTSMFTAIYCSRVILEIAERRKWITSLRMMSVFGGQTIDFLKYRRMWYGVSLVVIAIGLAATYFRGSEIFDHDLRGGSTARIVLNEQSTMDVRQVREALGNYQGKLSEREEVRFSIAQIRSEEFPDRVFKVDSNIPIWDKPEPAPYESLEQALVKTLGSQLMQLHVGYDPNSLQISKASAESETGGVPPNTEPTGGAPTGQNAPPPANQSSQSSFRWWSTGLSWLSGSGWSSLLQESAGTTPQETPPQEPAPQDPPAQETPAPPDAAADKPAQEPAAQETVPPTQTETTPAPGEQVPQQPAIAAVDRYVAKVDLKFAQPINRGTLINTLIAAAEKTQQVTLDKADIQALAPGVELDELSAKSKDWTVTMNIGREADAKLILDSLQENYNGQPYFPTISGVGGQIAAQTQWRAVAAIIASLIGIIIYVWIRFQNVAFGIGAVVSLIHDVLVALGAIALSYWLAPVFGFAQVENFRISLPIIAAFLTLIGYSINDTIVVFDRIREVRGKRPELTAEMINVSVSQTLSRTILTTFLTLLAVIVLYFFGGESIHGFAFALVIGMIAGTYSTIFIASPVALWWLNRSMSKRAAKKAADNR